MQTVIGRIVDELGLAAKETLAERGGELLLRHQAWASPASGFRREQAATIPVDLDHGRRPVGVVEHLERASGGLWTVCSVFDDVELDREVPIFLSGEIDSRLDGTDSVLKSLALTETPASVGARPITILKGDLTDRRSWALGGGLVERLVDHAVECRRDRRNSKPILIREAARAPREAGRLPLLDRSSGIYWRLDERGEPVEPVGPLLYRQGQILAVR